MGSLESIARYLEGGSNEERLVSANIYTLLGATAGGKLKELSALTSQFAIDMMIKMTEELKTQGIDLNADMRPELDSPM